jgi:hypothetical protein
MTEAEWLTCGDSFVILTWLEESRPRLSDRKLRLFNCACARRLEALWDEESRTAVEASEAFADRQIERNELECAFAVVGVIKGGMEAYSRAWEERERNPEPYLRREVRSAAHVAAGGDGMDPWYRYGGSAKCVASSHPKSEAERAAQAQLIRCIFGNPFRPVAFNPDWRTSDVMLLARGIYDERAFDRMPILADALQDAGCDSDDILNHCRDTTTPHARGCWVVYLVLGKS